MCVGDEGKAHVITLMVRMIAQYGGNVGNITKNELVVM